MAENALALLQYVSAKRSPIPILTTYTRPTTVLQSRMAFAIQMSGIGTTAVFFLLGLPLLVVMFVNPMFNGSMNQISLSMYSLGQALPLLGSILLIPVIEVFVPLVRSYRLYRKLTELCLHRLAESVLKCR